MKYKFDRFSREASRLGGASIVVQSAEDLNESFNDILYIFQQTQSFKEAETKAEEALTNPEKRGEPSPLYPLGHHVSKGAVSPEVANKGLESTKEALGLLVNRTANFGESLEALRNASRRTPQLSKLSKILDEFRHKITVRP